MSNVLLKCGGFSSQLANNLGMPVDGDPLWGSRFDYTNPTAVIQTHMDFLSSGAQIILSNTYQASIEGYMKYLGLNREESVKLIGHSVRLAKAAKKKFLSKQQPGTSNDAERDLPLIMASIGPYGACLHDGSEYDGSYAERVTKQELQQWHRVRIDACLAEGVDGLALETIPIQLEAECLVELLLSDYPKVKFWVSFQCKDEQQLAHGENFADAVLALWRLVKNNNAQEQLLGLGVNCVNPKFVTPLFKSLHARSPSEASEIPLLVYSNRGEIWDAVKGAWTGQEECVPLENYVPEWIELGARIIGGCCRIYPDDIKRIRQFLDSLSNNNN